MKYILFIIAFVFLFGKVVKYALKYWLSSKMNEAQRNFNQTQNQSKTGFKPREGSIHVDFDPRKGNNSSTNSKSGDYIDYEEVK